MSVSGLPLVSIVIPAYNSADYIDEAIDSCLAQTYQRYEIIIVDDGSTDGTRDLIEAQYGDRVRYIYQSNAGPAAARNRGILAAEGKYIQFCDADDILLPEKIARCVEVLEQHADVGVVYTRYRHVAADGTTLLPIQDPPLLDGDVFCRLLMSNANAILTSASMVRRAATNDVGLFDTRPELQCSEDWDFFLRLASAWKYASVDEKLVRYRHRPTAVSANKYCNALGRLVVMQKAKYYARRTDCLTDAEYDRLLAGRHHVLGMVCWERGRRAEARDAFRAAIRLDPRRSVIRRLYIVLSYVFPVGVARLLQRLRPNRQD